MSLLFWRKKAIDSNGKENEGSVPVTKTDPLPTRPLTDPWEDDYPGVEVHPDRTGYLPPVAGQSVTRRRQVPGIGTGAAYTAADAFGALITLPDMFRPEKRSGQVTKIVFHDLDDEGLQKDCIFFRYPVTTTADNAAYAPTDDENLLSEGVVSVTSFENLANNQIGTWTGSLDVESSDTNLYLRIVTQGADNIAAGQIPWIDITVVPN